MNDHISQSLINHVFLLRILVIFLALGWYFDNGSWVLLVIIGLQFVAVSLRLFWTGPA